MKYINRKIKKENFLPVLRQGVRGVSMCQIVRKNSEGFALVIVLMIILILGVITPVLVISSGINLKLATNIAVNKKAAYAAEAGVEYGKCILKNEEISAPEEAIDLNNGSYFTIEISEADSSNEYIITAKGFYQDKKEKIEAKVKVD
jgi:hypothetical protein